MAFVVGGHHQIPTPGWLASVYPHVYTKVFQLEMAESIKAVSPTSKAVFRHHVDNQEQYLLSPDKYSAALAFLARFAAPGDSTWARYAPYIDVVLDLNEYYATGESADTRWHKIQWGIALQNAWNNEYRPKWPHIKLGMCNTAVGNDIPLEIAQVTAQNKNILVYHPYMPVKDKQRLPSEGLYYSRRYEMMDQLYRANGVYVTWYFGELGPIGYSVWPNGDIALDPGGGWRRSDVCDNDLAATISLLEQQHQEIANWNAQHGNRVVGGAFFTTMPQDPTWRWFHIEQPQLGEMMLHFYEWSPSNQPPTEPPLSLTYRPCDTTVITQRFGENPGQYIGLPGHDGLDYGVANGLPFYAAAPGTVVHASNMRWSSNTESSYGWHVVIQHSDFATVYAHALPNLPVQVGDVIPAGTIVGYSGNTGYSQGYHLHFGVLDQTDLRDPDNGYPKWVFGRAIDPEPYLAGLSAPPPPANDHEPPLTEDEKDEFWKLSIQRQVLSLNPSAAIEREIAKDGFNIVETEFWSATASGDQWAMQAAESLVTGERRLYLSRVGQWDKVYWYTME